LLKKASLSSHNHVRLSSLRQLLRRSEAFLHRSFHLFFTLLLILSQRSPESMGEKFRWTDGICILLTFASLVPFYQLCHVITRYPYVHPLGTGDMVFGSSYPSSDRRIPRAIPGPFP
jgi:hypothetical protein